MSHGGSVEDQVVIQATCRAEPAVEDAFLHDSVGDLDQQHGVDIVTLQKKRRLPSIAWEAVQDEPIVPVVLFQALLDHVFNHVIGHQFPLGDDAFDAGTELGVALDVPAKNVADTDVHQIERLLEQSGLSYQYVPPDYRFPYGHTHKQQEEVFVVVGGSGRMKLDDEIVEVKKWDVVRVPPGTWRGYEAGPEGLEILVFGAPNLGENPREDVEGQRDWWAD